MKKIFLGIIATVILSTNLMSAMTFKKDIENQKNIELLSSYNDFVKGETIHYNKLIIKRKWWQVVGQVCAIAAGDAGGAAAMVLAAQGAAGVVGAATAGTGYVVVATGAGIVGAVGGSYAAYCGTGGSCRMSGNFNSVNPEGNPKIYDLPKEFDYLENLGTLHNQALEDIYFSSKIDEKNWLLKNIPNTNSIDFDKFYNSKELNNAKEIVINSNINYKNSNYKHVVLLDELKSNKLINDVIYSTLNNYFTETSKISNFNEYMTITDKYVALVTESKYSKLEKEALFAAFSVSSSSFYYWYNFELNE